MSTTQPSPTTTSPKSPQHPTNMEQKKPLEPQQCAVEPEIIMKRVAGVGNMVQAPRDICPAGRRPDAEGVCREPWGDE
ncbi:hypothetical protein JYU34_007740 [Plutella xylostella]|uniref:Uncharacterized protein n=1 Tax=Plutella xylostella TaxID=51655 RepID=A0ABQ7QR60_PLUXY|nr:hypothetical protein JYU34_007740 [Plutella xylostella]